MLWKCSSYICTILIVTKEKWTSDSHLQGFVCLALQYGLEKGWCEGLWGGGRTLPPLPGGLVPVLGRYSHLPQVFIFLASAFPFAKLEGNHHSHFSSPQTVQPRTGQTHFPRSCPAYLFSWSQQPHSQVGPMSPWRLWDGLRDTSSVQPRAPGEVAMWQEIQGREWRWPGPGGRDKDRAQLLFSSSAGGDQNMMCRQLGGRWQETWEQGTWLPLQLSVGSRTAHVSFQPWLHT